MKTKLTAIIILYVTATAIFAQLPDLYSIAAFNVTAYDYPERANFVIKNSKTFTESDTLLELSSPPAFIKPGRVVMRKKYGADYRLYSGELDTTAFNAFPPIYVFKLPPWSRSGQAMWYRFYAKRTGNRNLDLETVFFDNERMYVQHHEKLFYSRNDEWDSIVGATAAPYGELLLDSEPPGADIYLYGKATGKRTPALFRDMIAGRYEAELFLPDYRFQRRSVSVPAHGSASSSFQLMSDFDTLYVLGEAQHGILVLPYPPIDSAYRVGDTATYAHREPRLTLLEGEYRIVWNGGGLYKDVDTVISVPAGRMIYFSTPFVRLVGSAVFELHPPDALLCIEGFPCQTGGVEAEMYSGFYTARISRFGYEPERRKFVISHGKKYLIRVTLDETADRDYDGFPDSLDRCPDDYGLYDGCPKPGFKYTARMKWEELTEYMETEPLSFAISGIGIISRSPTGRRFRTVLSEFSGGSSGGLNNYNGVTLGNAYQVSFRGFTAQAELGQWVSGVKFRRPDTLYYPNRNNTLYKIWYDSLYNVDPAIFFPSTALSVGFKYRLWNYSVGYSIGRQWEDIIIDDVEDVRDGELKRIVFDNDWWFHELMVEADLFIDTFVSPSLYAKFKLPFGPTLRTKWHSLHCGLQFRIRPSNWKSKV
ncbi:MAG: PEGA domain-containing protein [Chitinispirillales bacterium]|jgi:hypothetical protein|nr:PEGA domain-containing protein [Chitinispirillales bacterium]